MMVDGPETIGLHPKGGNAVGGGRRRLFCLAMQSRRRRKKADGGRCRIEIEAALASPVFGQTRSIEIAVGVVWSAERGYRDIAAIGRALSFAPKTASPACSRQTPEHRLQGRTVRPFSS
jgi:hypothetical protein